MRISDWSSDVCSSDLRQCNDAHAAEPPAPPVIRRWCRPTTLPARAGPSRQSVSRHDHKPCTRWDQVAPGRTPASPATRPSTDDRSEEHTSELQSLMRISYAVFCLKKKKKQTNINNNNIQPHLQLQHK